MRMHQFGRSCLIGLALFVIANAAYAWGGTGHKLVGDIAEQYLTPEAKQAIAKLLADDRFASNKPSGRTTLGEIASWPDEIRSIPAMAHTKPWHFDDVPLCGSATPQQICPDGNCASVQLARLAAVLRDGRGTLRERNEALKWVVHLMGDIHQPLHETDNRDFGGNKQLVSFLGETKNKFGDLNLHSVWDENIVEKLLEDAGGAPVFLAQPVSAGEQAELAAGTAKDWMDQSHEYARTVVYGNLLGGFVCNQSSPSRVELGQAYYDAAAPVVALQLRRAGIRLARVLNAALASEAVEAASHPLHLSAIAPHLAPAPHLPDPQQTPGKAALKTAKAVCGMANTKDERHVTEATKKAVYESYGIAKCAGYCSGSEGCEVDHLISLELGGANSPENLWPQPYQGEWNAHDKDRLENKLKQMVCKQKTITLAQAQAEVSSDWISAYKKYIGARKPFKAVKHCP